MTDDNGTVQDEEVTLRPTTTIKAELDEWVPKYIKQVVALRAGGKLTATRFNELLNLLIEQGDDTISLITTVKEYIDSFSAEESDARDALTSYVDTSISTMTSTLNTKVAGMTSSVSGALSAVDTLTTTVEGYQTTVLGLVNEAIEEVQGDIDSVQAALTAAGAVVEDASTIYDAIEDKLGTADVVNNTNSDSTTKALSAAMGKWLNSNKAPSGFGLGDFTVSADNINNINDTGFYFAVNNANAPVTNSNFVIINVARAAAYTAQVAIKYMPPNEGDVYVRVKVNNTWKSWIKIHSANDVVDDLTSTDADKPLSANMGKTLDEKITAKDDVTKWNGKKMWVGSKDDLPETKDEDTIYFAY